MSLDRSIRKIVLLYNTLSRWSVYCEIQKVETELYQIVEGREYAKHSLFLYYCLLIIVLFSIWTTVNLLLPFKDEQFSSRLVDSS